MQVHALDHVNLRTTQLDTMIGWYADVLGLHAGPRPDFPFGGAWLYVGDRAVVHLVSVSEAPDDAGSLHLEHFALSATGLPGFLEGLTAKSVAHEVTHVPGMPLVQVNIHDPDGNHIHVDFDAAELP